MVFNTQHFKERLTIERVFGQITIKFSILANDCHVKLNKVPKVLVEFYVLYNIGKHINLVTDRVLLSDGCTMDDGGPDDFQGVMGDGGGGGERAATKRAEETK